MATTEFRFRSAEELDQMNLVEITHYREQLESLRIELQTVAADVRQRFNKANNAANAAARIGGAKEEAEIRATPGVAVAKVLGRQLHAHTMSKLVKAGVNQAEVTEAMQDAAVEVPPPADTDTDTDENPGDE